MTDVIVAEVHQLPIFSLIFVGCWEKFPEKIVIFPSETVHNIPVYRIYKHEKDSDST